MFGNVTAPQQAWHMYCGQFCSRKLIFWEAVPCFRGALLEIHKEKDQMCRLPWDSFCCCGRCRLPGIHRRATNWLDGSYAAMSFQSHYNVLMCRRQFHWNHITNKLQTSQVLVLHGLRRRGLCFSSTKDEALKPSGGNKHKVSCRSKFEKCLSEMCRSSPTLSRSRVYIAEVWMQTFSLSHVDKRTFSGAKGFDFHWQTHRH